MGETVTSHGVLAPAAAADKARWIFGGLGLSFSITSKSVIDGQLIQRGFGQVNVALGADQNEK